MVSIIPVRRCERAKGSDRHISCSPSLHGNQWIDGVHSRDSAIKEGRAEGAFVALIKLRRDRRRKGRASEMDCSAVKTRAFTVLDRDRSNSPERRTRTEVFFIFRTLVLKFRKFGISHSQNQSSFAFFCHLIKLMMLIDGSSYSFGIKHI